MQTSCLDSTQRYLLTRPRGGLNDTLAHLEKSILYAEAHDRDLIIDMSRSGLHVPFDDLFAFIQQNRIAVFSYNDAIGAELDRFPSVYPPALRHRVSRSESVWDRDRKTFRDAEFRQALQFDFGKDYRAQVMVYEQARGGTLSYRFLRRVRLRADIAEQVVQRLLSLGPGYDAVHIRHSDYKTAFNKYLRVLAPFVVGRRVLICSDSPQVKSAAQKLLFLRTTVLSLSDIPDTGGRPLHYDVGIDRSAANVDLFTDLFGLALSDVLFFRRTAGARGKKGPFSGFSILAELLRNDRDLVGRLLGAAGSDVVNPIIRPHPVRKTLPRRAQIWAQRQMTRDIIKALRKHAEIRSEKSLSLKRQWNSVKPELLADEDTV
jgi:hypothetical protein